MKKILSFLMMAMLFTTAFATEATMAAGTNGSSATVNDQAAIKCGTSSKSGDMTITVGAGATELTFYAAAWNGVNNSTLTITPDTKVSVSEITLTPNTGIAGNSPFTLADGTDEEDYKFTITLSDVTEETTFTLAGAKRFVVWNASYTTGGTPAVTVATPVISGTTPFEDETEVTISCSTTGASIYYTLDGSDPTANSTQYTGAFDLNATTTVKAIAILNGTPSSVATKEFVAKQVANVATVAQFNALEDGTDFVFTGRLVVSAQKDKYLYAQDETGGMLLYGEAPVYETEAVIPAGFKGTKTTFRGAPEATGLTGMAAATETQEITAKVLTLSEVKDNLFVATFIENVTVDATAKTLSDGETTIALYDRFGVEFPADGEAYDVACVTGYYNEPQVMPLQFVKHVVYPYIDFVVEGEFDAEKNAYVGTATVKVEVENMPEGGKVQYMVEPRSEVVEVAPAEEGEPTWIDYTEAGVALTQSAIVTVRVLNAAGEQLVSNEVEINVVPAPAPKYSLVGWINGADYACESDYENPGQYLFNEEGKLTVNFEQDAYVFVKLTDNSKWFLTENYVPQAEAFIGETATTTATFVNGANYGEKMQVPAGEVELTLTVNDENTVVLTYSLPGTKEPEQETVYYVAGNFNDWAADGAEMTKNENGIWEYAFQVEAGEYAFKVTDGTWNHSWPASNYEFTANVTSDVLITFNEETKEVNCIVKEVPAAPEVDFTVEGDYDDVQEAYVGSATVKVLVENMPEGGKVQYRVDLRDEQMVAPAEEEELAWIDYTEEGVVVTQTAIVSARVLDATGEELAGGEIEVVVVSKSTGINDINVAGTKAYKTIENGEVIIVKNGVKYNVMGQKK